MKTSSICTVHLQTLKYLKCIGIVACILMRFVYKILLSYLFKYAEIWHRIYRSSGLATTNGRTTHHSRVFITSLQYVRGAPVSLARGAGRACEGDSRRCARQLSTRALMTSHNDMVILTCAHAA